MFLDLWPPTITCRGRRILSSWRSFVRVPSRPLSHQETHVIRTEGFENLAPHLPSLSLISKYCFVLAMTVLSLAFHPLLLLSHFPAHSQRMHTNFASWRALSLVCLRTSSPPAYLYKIVHAFWRKTKTAVPQMPNQSKTGGNITKLGDHRRRGNWHISHIKHRTHQLTRNKLSSSFSKGSCHGKAP